MNYPILLDVWEGSLDIDEATLMAAGVAGLIVRVNDMNGGHHLDQSFNLQWAQAKPFPVRFPYFVYNPWVNSTTNYEFLMDCLPADAPKRIAVDIEVVKPDYSPSQYAAEVDGFTNMLLRSRWQVTYTGQWFVPYLSAWPKTTYWWARYLYALYPPQATSLSWEEMKAKLYAIGFDPRCTLGTCKLWQCSADRYILPGCAGRVIDLNVWNGTLDELKAWVGGNEPNWAIAITRWAREQPQPYSGPDPDGV